MRYRIATARLRDTNGWEDRLARLIPVALAFALVGLFCSTAQAACSWTNLANGTTANATQVMNNFDCVAPLRNVDGAVAIRIENTNAGSAAAAQFAGSNGTYDFGLAIYGTGFTTSGISRQNGVILASGTSPGGLTLATATTVPIYFAVANSEVARFDTSGNFLVGTTAYGGWAGNAKLEVTSPGNNNTLSTYNSGSGNALLARVDSTSTRLAQFMYGASTGVGTITTTGTDVTYGTSSDARLKVISARQGDYREAIQSLWIGDFHWKRTGTPGFGVLAQQAYAVMPNHQGIVKPSTSDGAWTASAEPFGQLALWGVKDIYKSVSELRKNLAIAEGERTALSREITLLHDANARLTTGQQELRAELARLRAQMALVMAKR